MDSEELLRVQMLEHTTMSYSYEVDLNYVCVCSAKK